MTELTYGKYRSLSRDWWNHIDLARRGSISRREVWNSVRTIAWGYSYRREEWVVLFSNCEFDIGIDHIDDCIEPFG